MKSLSSRFVSPEGSRKPEIYFLAEAPGEEEDKQLRPLIGRSGQVLRTAIQELNIDKSVRLFNVVPYRPLDERSNNRTPEENEIQQYSKYAKSDIKKCQPTIVVLLGKSALYAFFPHLVKESISSLSKREDLEWEGIKFRVVYHPSYILRRGGTSCSEYKYWKSEIARTIKNTQSLVSTKNKNHRTYSLLELEDFLDTYRLTGTEIALDYEASSLETKSIDFELAGIGLSTGDSSSYLVIKDFYTYNSKLDEESITKIRDFFLEREKKGCTFLVFNAKYEIPATLNIFGIELKSVIDVMQYCKTLNIGGGLKEISRVYLEEFTWTSDLDAWLSNFNNLLNCLKPTAKYSRPEAEVLMQEGIEKLIELLHSKENLNTREKNMFKALKELISIIKKQRKEDLEESLKILEKILKNKLQNSDYEARYTESPREIVSPYCGLDAKNTYKLYKLLLKMLSKEGNKYNRDLVPAANYYCEHAWLGYILELNGIVWNDEFAEKLSKIYQKSALEALRSFLLIPRSKKVLKLSSSQILEIQSINDLDSLKSYFNPRATNKANTQKFSLILSTKRLRFILLLDGVREKLNVSDLKTVKEYFPTLLKYYEAIKGNNNKLKSLETLRNKLAKNIDSLFRLENGTETEWHLVNLYSNWELPNASSSTIESIYQSLKNILDIDPDDRSTWCEEFEILYYHRLYKKIAHTHSNFIEGSTGRGSVKVIKSKDVDKIIAKRIRSYNKNRSLEKDETYIIQPSFKCNTAVTKRWNSGIHILPWNSEIRNIQRSRFESGFLVHFDYSQMELRILAHLSRDPSLLEAYKQGKDIHRFVASAIWDKDEEEVSDSERRFSKLSTFSLSYGKSIKSFADDFMGGDLKSAKKLFNSFFKRFPRVKDWIEEQHRNSHRHECQTIWGDPIQFRLHKDANENAAKRLSQNYPIQSSASNIAGVSISRIAKWIREHGLKTKLYCFTHDSCDADCPKEELLNFCYQVPTIAEEMPLKVWKVPVKIDLGIGVMGNEIVELKRKNDSPIVRKENEIYTLESNFIGKSSSVEKLKRYLQRTFKEVELNIEKEKEELISNKELFETKRAYSISIGKTVKMQEGTLRVR